jgi:hypothetical protein
MYLPSCIIYMNVHVYQFYWIYMNDNAIVSTHIYMYIYTYIHYIYIYINMYTYIYIYIYRYIYIYKYICIYICIYILKIVGSMLNEVDDDVVDDSHMKVRVFFMYQKFCTCIYIYSDMCMYNILSLYVYKYMYMSNGYRVSILCTVFQTCLVYD